MHHSESRIVPFTADLMFQIVADIERYPQFLPWVTALRLLPPRDNAVIAEMLVGFGPFRERYTSRVLLDPAARTIDVVKTEDGKSPFRQLENHWRFVPQGDQCRIEFSIAFEFRNPLLQAAASKAFEKALLKMTNAFVARAASLTANS